MSVNKYPLYRTLVFNLPSLRSLREGSGVRFDIDNLLPEIPRFGVKDVPERLNVRSAIGDINTGLFSMSIKTLETPLWLILIVI